MGLFVMLCEIMVTSGHKKTWQVKVTSESCATTFFFIILIQICSMDGSEKSGPEESTACSADPDSYPPVLIPGCRQFQLFKVGVDDRGHFTL